LFILFSVAIIYKMRRKIDWRLCFVADSEAAAGQDVLVLVEAAVAGGATMVQLRGKTWTTREFLATGRRAAQFLKPLRIPLIINDRVDIALSCEADGVHLGQADLPLREARKILGNGRIIGISVSAAAEALSAERGGADYVGAGPVFSTQSKHDLEPALGLKGLSEIRTRVRLPILAIGGIKASNAMDVIAAGADGIAVISAVTRAGDPARAAADLLQSIDKAGARGR
jgi:thiamine-phosphate pyrophosphorylase